MRRREFIAGFGGAAASVLAAYAQQTQNVWRIGHLSEATRASDEMFRQSLRKLGYTKGANLTTIYQWAAGGNFGPLADDLVDQNLNLIVAVGSPATRALKERTTRIPIVIVNVGDPVAYGFVQSLARPGGNITGMSNQLPEIGVKGLQYMKEILPAASKLAVLGTDKNKNPGIPSMLIRVRDAASSLGLETKYQEATSVADFTGAFSAILQDRPDVLYVLPDLFLYTQRRQIINFTLANRIPALYGQKGYVSEGGLMALNVNEDEVFRRAAEIADKVLKGANPADLPVEQASKFELFINLKTAKALGLAIPGHLIAFADEVLE